jgi:hypothetical protein
MRSVVGGPSTLRSDRSASEAPCDADQCRYDADQCRYDADQCRYDADQCRYDADQCRCLHCRRPVPHHGSATRPGQNRGRTGTSAARRREGPGHSPERSVPKRVRLGGVPVTPVPTQRSFALRTVDPHHAGPFVANQVFGRDVGLAMTARWHEYSYASTAHKCSGRQRVRPPAAGDRIQYGFSPGERNRV